jgi:putative intracellular protease/amidase
VAAVSATRVLAVVSSHREQAGVRTGFWLSELAYPYHHLRRRNVEVDVASPTGGEVMFSPFSDPGDRAERGVGR